MTQAFAQSAPIDTPTTQTTGTETPTSANLMGGMIPEQILSLMPLVLIFGIFYMLIIRPQQRKMKEHRDMTKNLQHGDRIVTAGGLIGTVANIVNENEVAIDLAENVRVHVVRHTISHLMKDSLSGGAPANDDVVNLHHHKKKAD